MDSTGHELAIAFLLFGVGLTLFGADIIYRQRQPTPETVRIPAYIVALFLPCPVLAVHAIHQKKQRERQQAWGW